LLQYSMTAYDLLRRSMILRLTPKLSQLNSTKLNYTN